MRKVTRVAASWMVLALLACAGRSEAEQPPAPDRYGVALLAGESYSPASAVTFSVLSAFALLDYGKVWHHRAPASLKFKVEAGAGMASAPEARFLASVGVLALRYLDPLCGPRVKPYLEAGIGGIYTDFRIEGQGLRFNFNPQLGAGVEVKLGEETSVFFAVRAHHLSNGQLYRENRGVSSVALMAGTFF